MLAQLVLAIARIEALTDCSIWMLVAAFLACGLINGPVSRLLGTTAEHDPASSVVVITGCDSGFGLYMAEKLRSRGYIVVSTCMTQAGIERLEALGIYTTGGPLDLTEEGAYAAVGEATRHALRENSGSKVWALINNAGIAPIGFTDWMPLSIFRKAMEVNFFAVIGVTQELLPLLKRCRGSRVINLSSMAGKGSGVSFGPYSGSKHALEGFAKALRCELQPFGVHVANVNPGFMRTPLIETSMRNAEKELLKAPVNVQRFYFMDRILGGNSDNLLRVQEPLSTVGDYITDHLVTSAAPLFNHYVGYQAMAMRWYLMLPQVLQDVLQRLGTPVEGINYEVIEKYQAEPLKTTTPTKGRSASTAGTGSVNSTTSSTSRVGTSATREDSPVPKAAAKAPRSRSRGRPKKATR